ncbi:hypothetical protein [Caballeronia sp. M23-90]
MPLHSYLFVPGDRPERFSKALATAAHPADRFSYSETFQRDWTSG